MENERSLIRAAGTVIAERFGMETAMDASSEDMSAFRDALIARIQWLLDTQLERLMHILYRVDVDEHAVQRIFRTSPVQDIATTLADLIIERQLEKARTRARYASGR
ncbi:MAG: hypothetical protein M5R41_15595 [Bacteroidia bacterium]|nr:hypothetical protein [Bacteroidia bacterium]